MKLVSKQKPAGDQPKAIKELMAGIKEGFKKQTLLGVTGSGKTFSMANVIEKVGKPTLVIAHNKTLAAQLAQEYKDLFPNAAVHYFVSYYDYYRPEAYVPVSDTYIEKDVKINAEIDRLRHATTQSLLTRKDVIVVASVSCIYGLGNPKDYKKGMFKISKGDKVGRDEIIKKLIKNFYERTNADLLQGKVRAFGDYLEFIPVNEIDIIRVSFLGDRIVDITRIDSITREIKKSEKEIFIFPGKHFVSSDEDMIDAIKNINKELKESLGRLEREGKVLEAERLKHRTKNDIAKIKEIGYCSGIENYSRHFDKRESGEPPYTLLSFFPKDKKGNPDFLTIIDESHVTIPQLRGMLEGDRSRKQTLVRYGFRLPSAVDNRPLSYGEFEERIGNVIYTTATPNDYEKEVSDKIVKQIIRPTGLLDPSIELKEVTEKGKYKGQIKDIIEESKKEAKNGYRTLITVLTKKMSEDLNDYLKDKGIKSEYMHSDVKTIDRIKILTEFRKGKFDCLVGVNLLREGLDLPEVSLVGILDADKEGFLRSETSLIQTIGRAARNDRGRVILYADNTTGSLKKAVDETRKRRKLQEEYNKKHNIKPKTIKKNIEDITSQLAQRKQKTFEEMVNLEINDYKKAPKKFLSKKEKEMTEAVKRLDFKTAAFVRDQISYYKDMDK